MSRPVAALRAITSQRGRHAVYVWPAAHGGAMSYNTAIKRLQTRCAALDIPRYSFHQVRHWTGLVAAQMGKSKKAVATFLGQDDTAATERYLHYAQPELWEIARELEARVAPEGRDETREQSETGN